MRIVSLCPSLTELVFDLGRGDDLVGITKFCVHPADRVAEVEQVGGTKDPKVARILELAPDVVLLNEEENRVEDARALVDAGLRCHTSMPRTSSETAAMVRSIGEELERPERAEHFAVQIEERSARVRRAAEGRRPVSWAYIIWKEPLMTVNADTFVDALLTQAGGVNVFAARADRYPEIEPREFAEAAPELVLLCTEPFPFTADDVAAMAARTGLAPERFRVADGEYLCWHGSRTPAGIDYAEKLIVEARERGR